MSTPRLSTATFVGILVASLLPLAMVGVPLVHRTVSQFEAQVNADNEHTAQTMRDLVDDLLTQARVVLQQIAAVHGDGATDATVLERQMRVALQNHEYIAYIAAIDSEGRVRNVAIRGDTPERELLGFDLSHRNAVEQARRTGAAVWSDTFYSLLHAKKSVSIVVPMGSGMLLANLPTNAFEKLVAAHAPEGAETLVVDRLGALLFHPDPRVREQRLSLRDLEPISKALGGEQGSTAYSRNGVDYLGSTARVGETGWTVLVSRDRKEARRQVEALNVLFAEGGVLALLIALALAVMQARTLAHPIARFAAETRAIAKGSYEVALTAQQFRETAELAESISSMAGRIRAREGELKQSRARFEMLFNRNRDAIFVHRLLASGEAGRLVEVNEAARELLGLGEISACSVEQLLCACSRPRLPEVLAGLSDSPRAAIELDLCDGQGNAIPAECLLHRLELDGQPAVMWVARDLRQRRRDEQQLAASERRHRFLVESMDAVPFSFDVNTDRMDYVGPQAARILGMPPETWIGFDTWAERLHPEDREEAVAVCREAIKDRRDFKLCCRMIDAAGAVRWVHCAGSFSHETDSPPKLAGLMRDETASRSSEELLRKSEERLRALVDAMPVMVLATGEQGRVAYLNKEFVKVSGYAPEELIGRNEAWELLVPDARYRRWVSAAASFERGEYVGLELELKAKDGTTRTVAWTNVSPRAPIPGWKDWAVGFDVTDRKAAEREVAALERRLYQSQKMEAVGTLAGGVAHDFNNILGAVLGHAELLEAAVPESDEPSRDSVAEIIKACERARDLVEQILTFSRQREVERVRCRLGAIVVETLKLLRASIPSTVRISTELVPGSGVIEADPTQMQQILVNLCTNAYQAMRTTGGTITIAVRDVEVDPALAEARPGLELGPHVLLSVADTGAGIDEKILTRIYEPFFTTKPVGEGTGMGLAVVHGIVQEHGGAVHVQSTLGEGSTFEVYLPRGRPDEDEQMTKDSTASPPGGERILFVDDEPAMAKVGARLLESLGYQVQATTGGEEALEILSREPQAFDLVVTDQTMPRITGAQLAERLLALRPDLPVIVCTGYSDVLDSGLAAVLGLSAVLKKPVPKKTLAEAVRCALDSKKAGA